MRRRDPRARCPKADPPSLLPSALAITLALSLTHSHLFFLSIPFSLNLFCCTHTNDAMPANTSSFLQFLVVFGLVAVWCLCRSDDAGTEKWLRWTGRRKRKKRMKQSTRKEKKDLKEDGKKVTF